MNQFMQNYGLIVVIATVGLALVAMGLFGKNNEVLTSGLIILGGSVGLHVGGNTNVIPVKTADAVAVIQAQGGTVALPAVETLGKP